MPSRFLTALSFGIFIAIIALVIHYIEYHKRKDKALTIKKIKLQCECCDIIETYNDLCVEDLLKVQPCNNNDCRCKGVSRKVLEYIK